MFKLRSNSIACAALLCAATLSGQAQAGVYDVKFTGSGISANVLINFGPATDSKYSSAFEVTGVSGTFSDSNNGLNIVDASIGSLVAITHDAPEDTNLLAPHDFSRFVVTTGLDHGSISFDNLVYPGGSPQTASDYPVSGGFLDIYGLLFNIGGGKVVNLWSNGDIGSGVADYGAAVVTSSKSLDYVQGGVAAVPEPETFWLLGAGLLALVAHRRRSRSA